MFTFQKETLQQIQQIFPPLEGPGSIHMCEINYVVPFILIKNYGHVVYTSVVQFWFWAGFIFGLHYQLPGPLVLNFDFFSSNLESELELAFG